MPKKDSHVVSKAFLRVLDANLNRAREGLRVCEEVARMVLDEGLLTRRCQRLRYALERVSRRHSNPKRLRCRTTTADVGRPSRRGKVRLHPTLKDLAAANIRRVQEALRVLEEFSRLDDPTASKQFGLLRFRTYAIEKALYSKLSTLRHH